MQKLGSPHYVAEDVPWPLKEQILATARDQKHRLMTARVAPPDATRTWGDFYWSRETTYHHVPDEDYVLLDISEADWRPGNEWEPHRAIMSIIKERLPVTDASSESYVRQFLLTNGFHSNDESRAWSPTELSAH